MQSTQIQKDDPILFFFLFSSLFPASIYIFSTELIPFFFLSFSFLDLFFSFFLFIALSMWAIDKNTCKGTQRSIWVEREETLFYFFW